MLKRFILENHTELAALFVFNSYTRRLFTPLLIFLCKQALGYSLFVSRQEYEQFQFERIAHLIRKASRIRFWEERFRNSGYNVAGAFSSERFHRLPFLTREEMQLQLHIDTNDIVGQRSAFTLTTSGTINSPIKAVLDARLMPMREAIWREQFGVDEHMRNREKVLSFAVGNNYGFTKKFWHFRHLNDTNVPELVREAVELAPTALVASPSRLLLFMQLLQEHNVKLPIRKVYTVGETLTAELRGQFVSYFQCPLANVSGMAETGGLTAECEFGQLHIYPFWTYVEVVDDSGKSVPNGVKGRIVITHLHNFIAPLIRYLTGDLGILQKSQCQCGRNAPRLTLYGRTSEFLVLSDGTLFPLADVLSQSVFPLAEQIKKFKFVQNQIGKIDVFVTPSKRAGDSLHLEHQLCENIEKLLGNRAEVNVVATDSVPYEQSGWKQKSLVSTLSVKRSSREV